jgi:repressor LexA
VTAVAAAPLTPVQQRVLGEIRKFIAKHGYAPSLRELADQLGRGLTSTAYQVDQLALKGRIRRVPNQPRAMVLLDPEAGAT